MVKWADHNKTALETEIDRLRDRVRDFRQTLELRAPLGPERVLDIDSTAAHADYVPRMPPDALLEVHEALKSINRRSLEPASFSLSIAESCESNRRAITDFPSMESALMPRSNVFLLQKQESNTESTLMIVEGFSTDTTNLQEPPRLVNAESIVRPARCDTVANYVSCGFVASVGRNDIEHQVFVETQAWVTSGTFSDLLEQGQTQALLTPPKLVEVFETILIAYLDFEKVRNYCRYPRLEDYKTYLHPQYRDDLNIAETSTDLTWRVPYLSCGLGTPQPRRIPGASKEDREPDEAVIRLGLVLFQLGSHSKEILIPDAAASVKPWRTLKLEALNRFHEVTNICGLALANVVEACLLANARTEKKTVISCLSKLENLKTLKTLLSN